MPFELGLKFSLKQGAVMRLKAVRVCKVKWSGLQKALQIVLYHREDKHCFFI